MEDFVRIPVFPLTIFPLPGELVPLHIFEPRYRQLLEDAEQRDISFGIFFNHELNTNKFGSLVTLESVIKRYAGGESDIVVKCSDLFNMNTMYRNFLDKLYPGGEVRFWNIDLSHPVNAHLSQAFVDYLSQMKINRPGLEFSVFQIAAELNLGFEDRLKLVGLERSKQENFLLTRLKYHHQILTQAERAKDIFHLN